MEAQVKKTNAWKLNALQKKVGASSLECSRGYMKV